MLLKFLICYCIWSGWWVHSLYIVSSVFVSWHIFIFVTVSAALLARFIYKNQYISQVYTNIVLWNIKLHFCLLGQKCSRAFLFVCFFHLWQQKLCNYKLTSQSQWNKSRFTLKQYHFQSSVAFYWPPPVIKVIPEMSINTPFFLFPFNFVQKQHELFLTWPKNISIFYLRQERGGRVEVLLVITSQPGMLPASFFLSRKYGFTLVWL